MNNINHMKSIEHRAWSKEKRLPFTCCPKQYKPNEQHKPHEEHRAKSKEPPLPVAPNNIN
jgi:hypothetical protein